MAHVQQPSTLSTASTAADINNDGSDHLAKATTSFSSLPSYIPSEPSSGKLLVLCFDGTGDQFDSDNSNVVQLVSMLKKDDKTKQMVYYQAGIGTYTSPAVATPLMSKISKILDEMLAWNLDAHVMGGYEFLMQNYIVGDRICIFGFSRGAYTARSLAGMVHKIGLIPADNLQQVPFAYKMYTRTDSVGWDQSNGFKKAFSVDVPIHFVGVWDTVDSVGIIPKRLPFTTSNTIIRTFRHAVSLDERRVKFKANLWNRPTDKEKNLGLDAALSQHNVEGQNEQGSSSHVPPLGSKYRGEHPHPKRYGSNLLTQVSDADGALDRLESMNDGPNSETTNVEEVWFAGCHCDIGGGSVSDGTRNSLARIPIRWMVRECFKTNSGIMFNTEPLREIGIDPSTIYPVVLPRPPALFDRVKTQVVEQPPYASFFTRIYNFFFQGSGAQNNAAQPAAQKIPFINEEEEELRDALSPKYDQLSLNWFWWILEILPISVRYQKGDNQWMTSLKINMGEGRHIPPRLRPGVKVHRSVKLRMEAQCKQGQEYQPQANPLVEPKWTD